MSELKSCFKALGFTKMPEDAATVVRRCGVLMEQHKDSTESDRLARHLLREILDLCRAQPEELHLYFPRDGRARA